MTIRRVTTIILITLSIFSGFGATPSKPDFAYPKTVSKNALTALNKAIKKKDNEAIIRNIIDYSLAQQSINPNSNEEILKVINSTKLSTKDSITNALISLVTAKITESDSVALITLNKNSKLLQQEKTSNWDKIIVADQQFFPTLYDFAIGTFPSLIENDSIYNAALKFNEGNKYNTLWLELQRSRANDYDSLLRLYEKYSKVDAGAYLLVHLAMSASTIEQRTEVFKLCNESCSTHHKLLKEAQNITTKASALIEGTNVIKLGEPYSLLVKSTYANDIKVKVEMISPTTRKIKEFTVAFQGKDVFESEKKIDIIFSEYGEYKISHSVDEANYNDGIKVCVTDFLINQQTFGQNNYRFAVDAVNGSLQNDVLFSYKQKRLFGERNDDKYSPSVYVRQSSPTSYDWQYHANILTDRSLYKQGDKVNFVATLMQYNQTKQRLVTGATTSVILRDANKQHIDSINLISDEFGRITGEFILPSNTLNGYFEIEVLGYNTENILVSDHKAPTYKVELYSTKIDSTSIEISGNAIGYNGFPIRNAKVKILITELPSFIKYLSFKNNKGKTILEHSVTTDINGNFRCELPLYLDKNLSVQAIVTSPTGETHEQSSYLPLYKHYIVADIPQYIHSGTAPDIKIFNENLNEVNIPYNVDVIDINTQKHYTPNTKWSNIPSGEYSIKISAHDAETYKINNIIVYNKKDKLPPIQTALFVPKKEYYNNEQILIGTSFTDSHILYTLWSHNTILEQKWLTPKLGNFNFKVTLPNSINNATVTLLTARNYKFYTSDIKIKRKNVANSLNISLDSFRDRVNANDTETWKIKVRDNFGSAVKSAIILNIYAKPLEAIKPLNWSFNKPTIYSEQLSNYHNYHFTNTGYSTTNYEYPTLLTQISPKFYTYDKDWLHKFDYRFMRVGSSGENALMSKGITSVQDFYSGNEFRLSELPTCYWNAQLVTDNNGELEITVPIPNFNTTWLIKLLAYNNGLLCGNYSSEMIANKPVMITPQWPNFLRSGDIIQIRALISNNSKQDRNIESYFEIYDIVTNEVIHRKEFSQTISPESSDTVIFEFKAPQCHALGLRAKAISDNYTDGEQNIIPILTNEIDVTTGDTRSISADSTEIQINVPQNAIVTLSANAIWECVTALPGLQASDNNDVFAAINCLFSAATAKGLMRQHPEIALALHKWGSDSLLVSKLELNDELKIAVLNSTPFLSAALNETDQKRQLQLLFNAKEVDKVIAESTANLAKHVRNNGFTWVEISDRPSLWVTTRILTSLSKLKEMGFLPQTKELNLLIKNAIQYLDNEIATQYSKDNTAVFIDYTYLRSQFPEFRLSSITKKAINSTIQHIIGNWREFSLPQKAKAAVILFKNAYPTTAKKLTESLRQHEVWQRPETDPTYLEAFSIVEPKCKEIDLIRAEYIARKQNNHWGHSVLTSDLIASIINCGTNWLIPANNQIDIIVNNDDVYPNIENIMGLYKLYLPNGGNLEIRKSKFPAWVGIHSHSIQITDSIKASSNSNIKISHSISGEMKIGSKVTLTVNIESSQSADYIMITQPNCPAFEAINQLPSTIRCGSSTAYREPCTTKTNWYFTNLPKGKTTISETYYINSCGQFTLAPTMIQSMYEPAYQAHSQSTTLNISE